MPSQTTTKTPQPQAFISTYAPRIRTYGNSLLTPVIQPATVIPTARTTKRGTTAINYAEDGFDDTEHDDSEGPRSRPTGLRSLRKEDVNVEKSAQTSQLGKELSAPVEIQGIWREWFAKPRRAITERQRYIQCLLPLTLIPIRIDLNIPSFRPEAAWPRPANARENDVDESLPVYKPGDPTPAYSLRDSFLWNLHEALITPDQYAKVFVDELDFPHERKQALVMEIAKQIRQQLEEYAGVALHPLFHSTTTTTAEGTRTRAVQRVISRDQSFPPGAQATSNGTPKPISTPSGITATATPIPTQPSSSDSTANDINNPDDTYRCILTLSINLLNRLYTDKFEWSLLHPPGLAEAFAKQTCADLGLAGEWVPALTHAIYEAVLRLKKEACENGGLVTTTTFGGFGGELENDAADAESGSGWRYVLGLGGGAGGQGTGGEEWEPRVEVLSKEEIEKREGDRERRIRRLRRETARFSSTANLTASGLPQGGTDYFTLTPQQPQETQEERMGRGERSKKKRRFRSLSPVGRDHTPGDLGGLPGYGGGASTLQEWERYTWRCAHCCIWGSAVWAVRDGPGGPRTLCMNCGLLWERDGKLPGCSKELFAAERAYGAR